MSDHSLSFWVTGPGCGALRPAALAAPQQGEVIVQALFSGVSRGTESLVFNCSVPASEAQRMRAPFQEGEFPAPVKYGYCMVGRVVAGSDALRGQPVFCLHPHQDRFVIPADAVQPLPPGLPPERAILAANMETALNALWDGGVLPGDRVAVIGAGSVGCLSAWLAGRIPGCEVQLVDINPRRARIAETLGVGFATPDDAQGDVDVVIHASGSPQGAELALTLAGDEATVIELSWYGQQRVSLPLGEAFHSRRLTFKCSQVGRVATVRRVRHSHASRLRLALSLLADPVLDVLIDSEAAFTELPAVMSRLCAPGGEVIMHRVRYE